MKWLAGSFGIVLLLLVFSPQKVLAHVGGVPFLKINGQYTPANSAYFSNPALKSEVPQDIGAEKYLVNKPINFEIDVNQIPVQREMINQAVFRWSFEEGSQEYSYGLKPKHTYSKIGSHLAALDIQAPGEKEFTPYDVIQLDVVDDPGYQLPTASIEVLAPVLKTAQPFTFKANFKTAQNAKIEAYFWFVEDQKTENKPEITATFTDKDFFTLVFLSYQDEKGFRGYRAVWVEGTGGQINLPFPPNSHDEVILAGDTPQTIKTKASSKINLWLVGLGVVLFLGVAGLIFKKKK